MDENGKEISQNQYAEKYSLSSSTISKIKESEGYDIPFSTILSICLFEEISLAQLFKEFENKFGNRLKR